MKTEFGQSETGVGDKMAPGLDIRALLKQHPEVVSWADFFAAQRKHRSAV